MNKSLKEASIKLHYDLLVETLKKVNFNKTKAAKLLDIDRKTLYNILQRHRELEKSQTASIEIV